MHFSDVAAAKGVLEAIEKSGGACDVDGERCRAAFTRGFQRKAKKDFEWELLVDEDTYSPFVVRDHNDREKHVYLEKYTGSATYSFSRYPAGMNAFSKQLEEWIQEASNLCKMNYALALPQVYFTKVMFSKDEVKNMNEEKLEATLVELKLDTTGEEHELRSRLLKLVPGVWTETKQLLLPLYCGRSSAVLALTVSDLDSKGNQLNYYRASTVLTKRMARQNARIITTPQVLWLADAQ